MSVEIVETVYGYDAAQRALKQWAAAFNESNGAGRMEAYGNIAYHDSEGSGEFYKAVCRNLDTATHNDGEIWDIVSGC